MLRELTGEELGVLLCRDSTERIKFVEPGLCALPMSDTDYQAAIEALFAGEPRGSLHRMGEDR